MVKISGNTQIHARKRTLRDVFPVKERSLIVLVM